jgi:hypothetical protein
MGARFRARRVVTRARLLQTVVEVAGERNSTLVMPVRAAPLPPGGAARR